MFGIVKKIFAIIALSGLPVGSQGVWAEDAKTPAKEEFGSPDEAKQLTESAVTFFKANGKEKSFAAFNDPKGPFMKKDLYIFVIDDNGYTFTHKNPNLVGKTMLHLKDADGKLMIKSIIEASKSKSGSWVEYKWMNPVTQKVADKTSYVVRHDNLIFGCGAYK